MALWNLFKFRILWFRYTKKKKKLIANRQTIIFLTGERNDGFREKKFLFKISINFMKFWRTFFTAFTSNSCKKVGNFRRCTWAWETAIEAHPPRRTKTEIFGLEILITACIEVKEMWYFKHGVCVLLYFIYIFFMSRLWHWPEVLVFRKKSFRFYQY